MKVCVVGSGGREHALAAALAATAEVVVAPGNPGMAGLVCSNVPPEWIDADLWVIGPEQPLVEGLADRLRGRGAPRVRAGGGRCPPGRVQSLDERSPGGGPGPDG